MIITVTETGGFMQCRRRWDYSSRNRQNLEPIINHPAFALGRLMHSTLEHWTNGDILDEDLDTFYMTEAATEVEKMKSDYHKAVGAHISPDELGDTFEALQLGRSMVANYQAYYKTPLPKGFNTIQTEQTFIIKIPNTLDGFLEGTLDSLVEDRRGKLYVLERKTYKQRPRKDRLARNHQFLSYYWLLTKAFPDRTLGGILYDGMWKKEKPSRGQTIEDLFFRNIFTRDPSEVAEFELLLPLLYADMANDPAIYPNIPWQGCWGCRFEKLCIAQSLDEDFVDTRRTGYKLREHDSRFDELELMQDA